jgi:membrane protease YdiL (CAAX protease family)
LRLLAPSLHNVPDNPLEALLRTPAGFAATLLVVIVAGGVREELQRAFLLHRFDQDLGGSMAGLAITSVAFGLGHTLQGRDVAVTTGVLGWLWGALTLARGGAVASMTSHALFNSLELARALAQP